MLGHTKWPEEAWTKAYFSDWPKCDNICNNSCEVFNAKILKYRGKPILTLLEEVRCYIMWTIAHNKMKLQGHQGLLPPVQRSRLEKEKVESNQWTPVWSGDGDGNRYEVQKWNMKLDVNLATGTCTCRSWQLTGMPCKHAIVAIAHKNELPKNYCHAWLSMGAYRATYETFINPTHNLQYWEPTPYEKPIPPPMKKKKAGRPKRARRKDSTETSAGIGATRMRRTMPPV